MKQQNKKLLQKHLAKAPRNQNSLVKWLLSLVFIVLAGGLSIGSDIFEIGDTTPSTDEVYSNDTIQTAVEQFDGTNFDVLPQRVKLPVNYTRVVDGDTLIVELNDISLRVRHLMIDTPETVKEGTSKQPFGEAASNRNQALLEQAEQVYLMLDIGPPADQYNRVLAYIYADEVLIAEQLLKEGLASVRYVNPPNTTYEKEFREAQAKAKQAGLNIWSIDGYVESNGYFNVVD